MSDEYDEYLNANQIQKESEPGPAKQPEPPVKEVVKEVPVKETVIEKVEVEKQVPIEKVVIEKVEVEKQVPVEKVVIKEVPVQAKPGTKVTAKEFEVGKVLMWLAGGLVSLGVFYGGKWVHGQSFMQEPKVVYKQKPPKVVTKWKTKWKTKTKTVYKTDRRLKENLATAHERIRILTAQLNNPRQVTCRYRHRLKVIHSRN